MSELVLLNDFLLYFNAFAYKVCEHQSYWFGFASRLLPRPMYFLQALSGSVKYIICMLPSITDTTDTVILY